MVSSKVKPSGPIGSSAEDVTVFFTRMFTGVSSSRAGSGTKVLTTGGVTSTITARVPGIARNPASTRESSINIYTGHLRRFRYFICRPPFFGI